MVLKEQVLEVINTPRHRVAIAAAQGVTENAVVKWIEKNSSRLTEYTSLQVIKSIMKVSDESELLTEKAVA